MGGTPAIAVAGAGALGMLLAGKLAAAGCPVELWTRTAEQARKIEAEGLSLTEAAKSAELRGAEESGEGNGEEEVSVVKLPARPLAEADAVGGTAVLLAVKQTALNAELLDGLFRAVRPGGAIVAFCNGIGHIDRLAEALPHVAMAAAVTTEGALRTGPRSVAHTGRGGIWLGAAPLFYTDGRAYAELPTERSLQEVEKHLRQAGFDTNVSNKMTERMLRKLLVNAVMNPLTALWRVPNGELPATPERLAVMRALFGETAEVLRASGLAEEQTLLWDELLDVCARTARNRSSMLQDVLANRDTEIAAINGAVVRLAARRGEDAPWNERIAALVSAIKNG